MNTDVKTDQNVTMVVHVGKEKEVPYLWRPSSVESWLDLQRLKTKRRMGFFIVSLPYILVAVATPLAILHHIQRPGEDHNNPAMLVAFFAGMWGIFIHPFLASAGFRDWLRFKREHRRLREAWISATGFDPDMYTPPAELLQTVKDRIR